MPDEKPVSPKPVSNYVGPSLNPVHVVAAIIFSGEIAKKSILEKEAPAVAIRCVKTAQVIVDAVNNLA